MYLNNLNLDKIITEAIKNVIDKSRYWPIPSNIEPQRYLKMVAKQSDIPIEDLTIENNRIYKLKSKKSKKIVKPADMDFDTFYNKMVLPNNPKEAQKALEYGNKEQWRPLPNTNRFFGGELDPSQCIEVSNMGRIRFIDGNDGMKSGINKGVYFAPTRNGVQVHVNGMGSDGTTLRTTGSLANMVMDTWGEKPADFNTQKYVVGHRNQNLEDCQLSNLYYRKRGEKDNTQTTTTEAQLKSVIKQTINEVLNELDWRTYQNASQKAYQKGGKLYGDERNKAYRQGDRFRRAATNSFNRLNGYGLKNVPYGDGDNNQMQTTKNDFYVGGNIYTSQGDNFNTMSGHVNNDGEIDTAYNTQSYNKNTKNFGNNIESDNDVKKAHTLNPALKMKQMKGDKQVRDYFNGKSKYVKGKGWQ